MTVLAFRPPPPAGEPPRPRPSTAGYQPSDTGNAERFREHWGDTVRHVRAWNTWLVYDGRRWAADETGDVDRRAKATVRSIYDEAARASTKEERAELAKHALKSESNGGINALLARAKAEPGISARAADFDADPWTLNVANGVLDLRCDGEARTVTLRAHDRAAMCRKLVEVPYDPEAQCPRWEAFIARILGDNEPMIRYVQRAVGYSLTGWTGEQCLFFLHGRGANGKSTFLETLRLLTGEYAVQAEFSTLAEKKSDGPRNDVARLQRARVVTASELGEGKRLNEELVKSLTGSETITARFLHQEHFEFTPEFKLWLAANHKPVIRGTDDGIWRRVRLIPFEVQIPEAERDPGLPAALRDELPGILAWAVAGCVLWQRHGLATPDAVRQATQSYREESDVLGAWIAENCELDAGAAAPAAVLYGNYRRWAEEGGEFVMSQTAFGRRLQERGHAIERRNTGKFRLGIRLTAEAAAHGATGGRRGLFGQDS